MREYQSRLTDKLVDDFGVLPGALLALQMSLGKTAITATALRHLLDEFMVRKALIVAPLRVAQKTWPDEFAAWSHLAPLRWKSLCGTKVGQKVTPADRQRWLDEFLSDPGMEIALINRENVVWLYEELRARGVPWPFDVLVYDESSRLKEGKKKTGTKRLSEFGVYAKVRQRMSFVIELTGTPSPNGVIDLWGQLYVIDQGFRLGTTKTAFLRRWFDGDYQGWEYTPKKGAEKEILDRIKDVMISLNTSDVIDLPPVITTPDTDVWVDLSPKLMADYKRFERDLALEEHDLEAVNRGVLTFKLLQYANGSVYRNDESVYPPKRLVVPIHAEKLAAMDSIVEATCGDNLLVAYSFKFDLAALKKRYPHARVADEEGALDDWNEGKVRMLLAHPASIGHGMNIQLGGHNIVWYGLTASLELYQQFNARLPRPGQTAERVFVRHVLTRGTFDERLMKVLADRDATQNRITQAVKWQLNLG